MSVDICFAFRLLTRLITWPARRAISAIKELFAAFKEKTMNTTHQQSAPGDLDPDFGDGGIVELKFRDGTTLAASGLTLDPDGRIYVAGPASEQRYGLARLNQNGRPDETFGTSGIVTGKFDTYTSWGMAVQIMPDGRLLLRGEVDINNVDYPALACFNVDGVLDTSFGTNGWVILRPPFFAGGISRRVHERPYPSPVAIGRIHQGTICRIHTSGKILVSAYIGQEAAIVRLNNDGSLDTSFGGTGYIIPEAQKYGMWLGTIHDLSSKLIAAGSIQTNLEEVGYPFLIRYNADASIDKNFGTGGRVTLENEPGQFSQLALTDQGKMVCIGYTLDTDKAMLVGMTQDGSPDLAFNNGDPVFTVADTGCAWLDGALVLGGQQIVVTGFTFGAHGTTLVGRFESDGRPDLSFGIAGLVTLDLGEHTLSGALAPQADRKIIVGGHVLRSLGNFGYVARLIG
ncbi:MULTISPECIES: delta-60 repeat domain-containing protein [Pseudomonas]|nr:MULTISPECIES: delta-60 repeat domain-containing protein [Pseudomonas]QVE16244.1 hypothetical protein KGD89_20565 [Pseudomonas cichorii]